MDDVQFAERCHGRRQAGVESLVGDDDELGVLVAPVLPDRLDRHAVVGEHATAISPDLFAAFQSYFGRGLFER